MKLEKIKYLWKRHLSYILQESHIDQTTMESTSFSYKVIHRT
jgi:hypothetical protein